MRTLFLAGLLTGTVRGADQVPRVLDGPQIMAEVRNRHDVFPFSYEEQNFILTDRDGRQSVRKARRYWRLVDDRFQFLLVFRQPPEIRGVSLLAEYSMARGNAGGIYLPALGKVMKQGADLAGDVPVMGTDFSVADLSPEDTDAHVYSRRDDFEVGKKAYYVVDARPLKDSDDMDRLSEKHAWRRLYINQETFFIERTDYHDRNDRLVKRLSRHDIRTIGGGGSQADMILMQNLRDRHSTLLKIGRRVYSEDYAPASLFRRETLFDNQHLGDPATWDARERLDE